MSGIAGALIYEPKIAKCDRLLAAVKASASRGEASFGVVRWSPSSGFKCYRHINQACNEWLQFAGYPETEEITIYIQTSRAESTTEWRQEKSEEDIPPFVEKGIAVAHNGIIANDEDLVTKYRLSRTSLIDAAIIPSLVAAIGVWETVLTIAGGFSMAIFDSHRISLVLCRNFLPLSLAWEPGIIIFASEKAFFSDAEQPFRPYHIWELPPYTGIELYADGYCTPVAWEESQSSQEKPTKLPYPQLIWKKHE